ncbi:MAG TPA: ABC transporter permease [Terriglobales bacterium]|nr:ABC transporter permease [Terriglobales bacterium]
MLDQFLQDLRYGVRGLRRSPGFATIAVLTLALGIGANTAIFSVIDAVLLRPLPYENPQQLVRVYETEDAPGNYPFTGPDFLDWKAQNHSFQDMTLLGWSHDLNLSGQGQPDHVLGRPAEANFFTLFGAHPILGRTFAPGEDEPGHDRVVVLSYGLWKSHFGADPKVVDRDVELNGEKYTVIGIMPAGFRFPEQGDQLWYPQDMDTKSLLPRGTHWATVVGRLKPGVTVQQAQAEMTIIAKRLEQQYPQTNRNVHASLVPLHEDEVGQSRSSLLTMLWAVALVLLIACANVANLLLSRAVARQKEMAVRGALGAGRLRLVRQLLTESVLLAIGGATLGLALAWAGVRAISALKHLGLPQQNPIDINLAVLGFTFGLAVLTGLVFGIVPALQVSRPGLYEELKGGAGSSVSPGQRRRLVSDILVVAEMGLSLVLLISAGLLLKDFMRLRSTNVGVRTEGVWTAQISLPDAKYAPGDQPGVLYFAQQQLDFQQALLERVRHISGVDAAALSTSLPLEGGSNGYVALRGQPFTPMTGPLVENHNISGDYFKAMGIPLLEGRLFTPEDLQSQIAADKRLVELTKTTDFDKLPADVTNAIVSPVVINQAMARTLWKGQDALDKLFSFGAQNGPWYRVVGVVGDVKQGQLSHPASPEEYNLLDGGGGFILVVHTSSPSLNVIPEIRDQVRQLDSSLPLFQVRSMDDVIAEHAAGEQFLATLVGLFSGLALLLAAVGIYGVLSYLVTQRTREIGIRMSLGASRENVLALVLKRGMKLAAIGFGLGLIAAIAAGRLLASVLHGVKPTDPTIIVLTALCLGAVALLACYLPARRAARVNPMSALRHE